MYNYISSNHKWKSPVNILTTGTDAQNGFSNCWKSSLISLSSSFSLWTIALQQIKEGRTEEELSLGNFVQTDHLNCPQVYLFLMGKCHGPEKVKCLLSLMHNWQKNLSQIISKPFMNHNELLPFQFLPIPLSFSKEALGHSMTSDKNTAFDLAVCEANNNGNPIL